MADTECVHSRLKELLTSYLKQFHVCSCMFVDCIMPDHVDLKLYDKMPLKTVRNGSRIESTRPIA